MTRWSMQCRARLTKQYPLRLTNSHANPLNRAFAVERNKRACQRFHQRVLHLLVLVALRQLRPTKAYKSEGSSAASTNTKSLSENEDSDSGVEVARRLDDPGNESNRRLLLLPSKNTVHKSDFCSSDSEIGELRLCRMYCISRFLSSFSFSSSCVRQTSKQATK